MTPGAAAALTQVLAGATPSEEPALPKTLAAAPMQAVMSATQQQCSKFKQWGRASAAMQGDD